MDNINLVEFLNTPPAKEKVIFDYDEKGDAFVVMPYDLVEDSLNILCGYNWGTNNFKARFAVINGIESISASVELNVTYVLNDCMLKRTLVGACTYPLSFFEEKGNNNHFEASALSLCIVNAARRLGRRFNPKIEDYEDSFLHEQTTTEPTNKKQLSKEDEKEKLKSLLKKSNKRMATIILSGDEDFKDDEELIELINQKEN